MQSLANKWQLTLEGNLIFQRGCRSVQLKLNPHTQENMSHLSSDTKNTESDVCEFQNVITGPFPGN